MRLPALVLALVLFAPLALALETTSEHIYIVQGEGFGGGGALIRNGETYFPPRGGHDVIAVADDFSGNSVPVRVCHEWTYDNGNHPTVACVDACDTITDALRPPPSRTTYRVIVDLRGPQGACDARATAGQLRVTFT